MKNLTTQMSPFSFTGSAVFIGFLLTKDLSSNEQNAIGNWFMLLGQVMETYAAQGNVLNSQSTSPNLETLNKVLEKMQQEINTLKNSEEK